MKTVCTVLKTSEQVKESSFILNVKGLFLLVELIPSPSQKASLKMINEKKSSLFSDVNLLCSKRESYLGGGWPWPGNRDMLNCTHPEALSSSDSEPPFSGRVCCFIPPPPPRSCCPEGMFQQGFFLGWVSGRHLLAAHSPPPEVPRYKASVSFQITNPRPRGQRPPPRPPPRPPRPPSSHQKAPLAPFPKKNSTWLERNDLLVNSTFLIRGTWVFNHVWFGERS